MFLARTGSVLVLVTCATAFARDITLAELIGRSSAIVVAKRDQPAEGSRAATDIGGQRQVTRWIVKELLHADNLRLEAGDKLDVDAAGFEVEFIRHSGETGIPPFDPRVYTPAAKTKGKAPERADELILFVVRTGFGFEWSAVGAVESPDQRATIVKAIKKELSSRAIP